MKKGKSGLSQVAAMSGIGTNIPKTAQEAMSATTTKLRKVRTNASACGCGDCNEVPSGQRGSGD